MIRFEGVSSWRVLGSLLAAPLVAVMVHNDFGQVDGWLARVGYFAIVVPLAVVWLMAAFEYGEFGR